MMSGVPLETCWAFNKLWDNKFYYKAASGWYFYWVIYDARIYEYQIYKRQTDPIFKNHYDDDGDYDGVDDGGSRFLWNVGLFQIPPHYITIDMDPITTIPYVPYHAIPYQNIHTIHTTKKSFAFWGIKAVWFR